MSTLARYKVVVNSYFREGTCHYATQITAGDRDGSVETHEVLSTGSFNCNSYYHGALVATHRSIVDLVDWIRNAEREGDTYKSVNVLFDLYVPYWSDETYADNILFMLLSCVNVYNKVLKNEITATMVSGEFNRKYNYKGKYTVEMSDFVKKLLNLKYKLGNLWIRAYTVNGHDEWLASSRKVLKKLISTGSYVNKLNQIDAINEDTNALLALMNKVNP